MNSTGSLLLHLLPEKGSCEEKILETLKSLRSSLNPSLKNEINLILDEIQEMLWGDLAIILYQRHVIVDDPKFNEYVCNTQFEFE